MWSSSYWTPDYWPSSYWATIPETPPATGPGYWTATYWPSSYWTASYWPKAGGGVITPGGPTGQAMFLRLPSGAERPGLMIMQAG